MRVLSLTIISGICGARLHGPPGKLLKIILKEASIILSARKIMRTAGPLMLLFQKPKIVQNKVDTKTISILRIYSISKKFQNFKSLKRSWKQSSCCSLDDAQKWVGINRNDFYNGIYERATFFKYYFFQRGPRRGFDRCSLFLHYWYGSIDAWLKKS